MKIFLLFLILIVLQRLGELMLAKRNEKALRSEGAVEYDARGYRVIVLMHTAFLVSFAAEYFLLGRPLSPYWLPLVCVFVAAQLLRYWAIRSLGKFWNTRILIVPGEKLVTKGPYRHLRHPNYISVVIEIAVIPLIFSCYITAAVFTVLNLLALRRRIRIEERALSSLEKPL
ncbi:MAG TPA: isoprenylcysteine carboxylmethyltransferase family protein [Thermodesulfobacteriota bacterium]|nr:isoprenylcysteine carboxylmethyltransferase family protein [Thermodesulfobacteriota bacterium]